MINIMLTCSAGMSTSLLVLHMQDEAKKRGLEANIWAVSETTVKMPNNHVVKGYYSKRDESIHLVMKNGEDIKYCPACDRSVKHDL